MHVFYLDYLDYLDSGQVESTRSMRKSFYAFKLSIKD